MNKKPSEGDLTDSEDLAKARLEVLKRHNQSRAKGEAEQRDGSGRISLHLLASLLPRDNRAATAACPARARAAGRGG